MSSVGSRGSSQSGGRRDWQCLNCPLSVADVYDIASDVGKEFEYLIDSHGPDHIEGLMQKVISALEHLEKFALEHETEKDTIEQLQGTITHLELEGAKRFEERQRNDTELEQIEEHYKQETRDLLSTVKKLQDENRKLASSLAAATEKDSAFSEDEAYFEVDLVDRLQSVIEKQRNQIKKNDQKLLDLKVENDELKCQNEKLNSCTKDLRRKLRTVQTQLHELVDERAELTAKLHDSHREIQILTRQLGSAEKECEDLTLAANNLEGKIIFSENDPARPRFTLGELKDILQERNSLKAKVSDLEDELTMFRPRNKENSAVNSPRRTYMMKMSNNPANCDCSYHMKGVGSIESDEDIVAKEAEELNNSDRSEDECKGDLPVQGPLPEDPDDAPWRRNQESGIRKLFRRVFGGGDGAIALKTSISSPTLHQTQTEEAMSSQNNPSLKKSFTRFSFLLPSQQTDDT